jgi:hypothetical protein
MLHVKGIFIMKILQAKNRKEIERAEVDPGKVV